MAVDGFAAGFFAGLVGGTVVLVLVVAFVLALTLVTVVTTDPSGLVTFTVVVVTSPFVLTVAFGPEFVVADVEDVT